MQRYNLKGYTQFIDLKQCNYIEKEVPKSLHDKDMINKEECSMMYMAYLWFITKNHMVPYQ